MPRITQRTDTPFITANSQKTRTSVLIDIASAVDADKREETRSTSYNLAVDTTDDVFSSGYCAATKRIETFIFAFVENVIMVIIYRRELGGTLS